MSAAILYLMRNRPFDVFHQRWSDNLARVRAALEAGDQDRALVFAREIERGARFAQCKDVMAASTIVHLVAVFYRIKAAS